MGKIENVIEEIMWDVDTYRNRCAEKYFNALRENGIEESDAVFNLFDALMDGLDDLDLALRIISANKKI